MGAYVNGVWKPDADVTEDDEYISNDGTGAGGVTDLDINPATGLPYYATSDAIDTGDGSDLLDGLQKYWNEKGLPGTLADAIKIAGSADKLAGLLGYDLLDTTTEKNDRETARINQETKDQSAATDALNRADFYDFLGTRKSGITGETFMAPGSGQSYLQRYNAMTPRGTQLKLGGLNAVAGAPVTGGDTGGGTDPNAPNFDDLGFLAWQASQGQGGQGDTVATAPAVVEPWNPVSGSDRHAKGGPIEGGLSAASKPQFFRGGTKGQADKIPAMLSDGEFVWDADTVAALGDGNTEAGASALEQMRQNIRRHKRSAPVNKIPPKAKKPEAYLPKKGK